MTDGRRGRYIAKVRREGKEVGMTTMKRVERKAEEILL